MKATEVLVSHHSFLRALFDEIERAMRDVDTSAEISTFACMVEALMLDHAEAEETLLFAPLDNMLMEKGQLMQLYSNHRECLSLLQKAQEARPVTEAKSLLLVAMRMLRDHFRDEERKIILLAETTFQPKSLQKLGDLWVERHAPSDEQLAR
ncbi:MAG: hemerythrin domain-containing protein [Verrucomicrobia bacterium]|nr:hemerythrin domain-containing protein [Verrucomicrobiota bacterium]